MVEMIIFLSIIFLIALVFRPVSYKTLDDKAYATMYDIKNIMDVLVELLLATYSLVKPSLPYALSENLMSDFTAAFCSHTMAIKKLFRQLLLACWR